MTPGSDTASAAARCAGWRAITYSAKGDTTLTINQIRVHNRTGQKKHCWK